MREANELYRVIVFKRKKCSEFGVDSASPFDLFTFFDDFEDDSYSEWWHPSTSDVQLSESGGILAVWPSMSRDWGVAVANAELDPLFHGYAFLI